MAEARRQRLAGAATVLIATDDLDVQVRLQNIGLGFLVEI